MQIPQALEGMVTGDLYHLMTIGRKVWSLRVNDLVGALLHRPWRLECNLIQNKGWVNSGFGELCRAIMLGRTGVKNACFWIVPTELLVNLFHWCHRPFIEGIVSLKGENRAHSHYKNGNQRFIHIKTLNTIGKDSLLCFSSSDFKWLLVSSSCWKCQLHVSLLPALPRVVQTCLYNFCAPSVPISLFCGNSQKSSSPYYARQKRYFTEEAHSIMQSDSIFWQL